MDKITKVKQIILFTFVIVYDELKVSEYSGEIEYEMSFQHFEVPHTNEHKWDHVVWIRNFNQEMSFPKSFKVSSLSEFYLTNIAALIQNKISVSGKRFIPLSYKLIEWTSSPAYRGWSENIKLWMRNTSRRYTYMVKTNLQTRSKFILAYYFNQKRKWWTINKFSFDVKIKPQERLQIFQYNYSFVQKVILKCSSH